MNLVLLRAQRALSQDLPCLPDSLPGVFSCPLLPVFCKLKWLAVIPDAMPKRSPFGTRGTLPCLQAWAECRLFGPAFHTASEKWGSLPLSSHSTSLHEHMSFSTHTSVKVLFTLCIHFWLVYLFGLGVGLFGLRGFPCSSVSKESACSVGHLGSIPGLGRSPGEGNGNPLQHSCLENPMHWGAW